MNADLKAVWKFRDRLVTGLSEDGHFRIAVVKATSIVRTAIERHEMNPLTGIILGRLLIGSALASSVFKGREMVAFKFESDGPINYGIAEANAEGEIRGYLNAPQYVPEPGSHPDQMIQDAIGTGNLHTIKHLYGQDQPYTSTIQLAASDITTDISYYYAQSEQIPTGLRISIEFDDQFQLTHAHGFLIQAMPDATDAERETVTQRIETMGDLSKLAEAGLYVDEMADKLAGDLRFVEKNRRSVDFFCSCSRSRFKKRLKSLDIDTLRSLAEDESQEIVCHYCNEKYVFTRDEINTMLAEQN